ncbi:MAG TPA: ABC transporter permease [Polyangiales bacterium]|nr:ABC transporter permease [Polyangiales bacterium]
MSPVSANQPRELSEVSEAQAADSRPLGNPPDEAKPIAPSGPGFAFIALQRYGLLVLFLLVVVTFSLLLPESFPTMLNFRNIAGNQSVLAIVTLAAIIPLICGHFDLSIGAVLGISSIATASLLSQYNAPLPIAIVVGIVLGAAIGLFNGLLIAKLGVNALITTLGVATVLTGLTSLYTGGLSIVTGIPDSLTTIGSGAFLGLPWPLYLLAVVALLVYYLLEHTPWGRHLHAVGSNPTAARLVGLNVDRIVITSFVVSGALVGFAGVLQVARQGGGNPQIGGYFMMPALSAAFLGATSIQPGRFNVPGTLLAVFFLATSVSGLSLFGVDNWVESLFNGTALVVAVALSTVLGRRLTGGRS